MITSLAVYSWFEFPHRFMAARKILAKPGARVLDVGCANQGPTITRRYFPGVEYHALDKPDFAANTEDQLAMDSFVGIDLDEPDGLKRLGSATYDVILCSHVLEHLANPYLVVRDLACHVAPGGIIYVETPAFRSLNFPRAVSGWCGIRGCLNFHDDPTHKALVDLGRVKEIFDQSGLVTEKVGSRRLWRRVFLLPIYALAGLILRGYVPASVVWDITGFARTLVAQRRP